ncbi:hypothetical protein [Curtobacterium poinsettiae]|uniref:hypothetical protein n=1 Tax=Curtobacterium poinsettiae TaxID=159612 RepID=UPI0021C69C06|nr:hypothetical protein [Curtobacterium flaccumfaciens]UXN18099.1 hypothetical protein N8D78_14850 [Curtobacterium flaccumfaciens pv. poinsettiae]
MADEIRIAFLLFPHLTQLDLTGPAQVLSRVPGARVEYVAATLDPGAERLRPRARPHRDDPGCRRRGRAGRPRR